MIPLWEWLKQVVTPKEVKPPPSFGGAGATEEWEPTPGARVPLGLRQRNPGHVRPLTTGEWRAQTGVANGFSIFDNYGNGIRAMALNLRTYYRKHGLNTLTGIISRYAPSSENDVGAYVRAVAQRSGLSELGALNLEDEDVMVRLVTAMIHHEQGVQPFGDEFVRAHVRRGLAA